MHKGETCYIFGDGPSIKWFDISKFADHPGICCGLLPFHNDYQKLDVKYCLLVEPWIFSHALGRIFGSRQIIADHVEISREYRNIISEYPRVHFLVHLSNYFCLHGDNVDYVFRRPPPGNKTLDALATSIDLFGGSFHAAISFAHYLGFSKMYLVGFDAWTIQPARNRHWYELGEGVYLEATNFALEFLARIKEHAEIFTISLDGQSRNVENIPYETYTGTRPLFKENFELVEQRRLNILATHSKFHVLPKKC